MEGITCTMHLILSMNRAQLTIGLVLILAGLGTADALITDTLPPLAWVSGNGEEEPTVVPVTKEPGALPGPTNPNTPFGGVAKAEGPNVRQLLQEHGFTFEPKQDLLFIPRIIPTLETTMYEGVLLKGNDRAGAIAWTESPKVKIYYLALKEALHSAFTPAVQDLVDETQRRENLPPRNLLTFLDTGISEERIAFARVRERIYEIHMNISHEDELFTVLDALTQ